MLCMLIYSTYSDGRSACAESRMSLEYCQRTTSNAPLRHQVGNFAKIGWANGREKLRSTIRRTVDCRFLITSTV
jgi:hypothetical protein